MFFRNACKTLLSIFILLSLAQNVSAIGSSARFAYVANDSDNTISIFLLYRARLIGDTSMWGREAGRVSSS
jgi:hypothetical protein